MIINTAKKILEQEVQPALCKLNLSDRTDIGCFLLNDLGRINANHDMIIGGLFNQELCLAFYMLLNSDVATSLEQAVSADVIKEINTMKAYIYHQKGLIGGRLPEPTLLLRALTNPLVSPAVRDPFFSGQRHYQTCSDTRFRFNAQHAKAPEGSVKELAAKYGVSISEVRRLKAAGQLHTLGQSAEPQPDAAADEQKVAQTKALLESLLP
ncbi:hypothetical protein Amme1_00082 [Pseudomonas phage vB_PpuM-Amme-1]